ncbi:MAG: DUF4347 domain-containing protein [Synechococcaceae cyanobacterium RL_1_2]|nr:DUF4347 domain-containing protein [Synechococcaceae cyanobacterium RL_1_2]
MNYLSKSSSSSTFVFIDRAIEDYQQLIQGKIEGVKVFSLEQNSNGLEQITRILSYYDRVTSIHLVGHGRPGTIILGNSQITTQELRHQRVGIESWFKGQIKERELVIYGCETAAEHQGQEFITTFGRFTQAQIYASPRVVGNRDRGGHWELIPQQRSRKKHPAKLAFTATALASYGGIFATGTDGAYTYYDSNEANRTVAFNDIKPSGTNIRLGDNPQAEWQETVNLPFSFNFYGTVYNAITISDNGGIIFGTAASQIPLTNGDIPRANPTFSIFPFWDDLRSNEVYTASVGNSFIVQWEQSTHGDLDSQTMGDPITFQVVLKSGSNDIDFVYKDISFGAIAYDNGASATIGINKSAASNLGIEYSQDQAITATSISFVSQPVLNKAFLDVDEGETVPLTSVNFNATDVDNGNNPQNVKFLVTNVLNGSFKVGGNTVTEFTQAQINSNAVTFVHDGNENAPSFSVQITDGVNSSPVKAITTNSLDNDFKVLFTNINDAPVNSLPTRSRLMKMSPLLLPLVIPSVSMMWI